MKIIFSGNPLSTQHLYRMTCRGNFAVMYMTAVGRARKEAYQWEAKSQFKGDPLKDEVELSVKLYFGDKRNRDIDNYAKILYDAMSGIVYEDDKQIKKVATEVLYSKENPRIEIELL